MTRSVAIVGATGSVGSSAMDVVRTHPNQFSVDMLVAGSRSSDLAAQIREFRPRTAGVADERAFESLCLELGVSSGSGRWEDTTLIQGDAQICEAIRESGADVVLCAAVGMAGLRGVLAAAKSGKTIALANKESLVVAGKLVNAEVARGGARIVPVDSEHSAIFQCLQGERERDVRSIVLTASGGPFLDLPIDEFTAITPERALKHPRWSMGRKISIDSATMVNKALEVIEAHWLFGLDPERIEVVVHPQSIVHSMVRFVDGTVLAQLSVSDMKGPIAYALEYPEGRLGAVMPHLDFAAVGVLEFRSLDDSKFRAVRRARECLTAGGAHCAVFNATNEVAVAAFLEGRIPFVRIDSLIEESLIRFAGSRYETLDEVEGICAEVCRWARQSVGYS